MECKTAGENIILELYGELDAAAKAGLEAHLEKCPACAADRAETKRVFALLDAHAPAPAPAADAERVWRRVQAGIAAPPGKRRFFFPGWRWAFAGASLALVLVAGIFLGRTWFSPAAGPTPKTMIVDSNAAAAGVAVEPALTSHLEDATPLLLDYLHAVRNGNGRKTLVDESMVRALLFQNLLLRQVLVEKDPAAAELLDDLDLVFKEIMSGETKASAVRDLIRERDILFRLRILKKNKELTS